jgi:hypothetical protein
MVCPKLDFFLKKFGCDGPIKDAHRKKNILKFGVPTTKL